MKPKPLPDAVRERRRYPRVATSCAVRYKPVADHPSFRALREESRGYMKNISGGGICFVAEEPFSPGQMLALEIALPGLPGNVISYGKVRWCQPRRGVPGFDVGVEFWWIGWDNEDVQHRIRDFITRSLAEEG